MVNKILVVEDSIDDFYFLERAVTSLNLPLQIEQATNGEEATTKLLDDAGIGQISLVVLDLQLPGMNGFELLNWIRSYSPLDLTKVVVLSASEQQSDIHRSCCLNANAYMVKPSNFEGYKALARNLYKIFFEKPAVAAA